jgi:uncharacterized membrane protein
MPWGQFMVQWLHVFFAIVWLGGVTLILFVVGPALRSSNPGAALNVGAQIGHRAQRVLGLAGGLTIVFGLLRATVFGPVRSWSFFSGGSAYGITLIIAFVLAIVIAVLGGMSGKIGTSLATATEEERPKLLARLGANSAIQFVGFILALTCMTLMRYGL